MEREKAEAKSKDETGYSEKQVDLDAEIQAGEWQNLRKFRTYQRRSRQGKIIASYQAISNRLNQLVGMYYKLVNLNQKEAVKLLAELKKLRFMQEVLLNCLTWSREAGFGSARELDKMLKERVPKDVWELIE